MKKKHIILALVMVFAATMNTACNDNDSPRVSVEKPDGGNDGGGAATGVESQSEEFKAAVEAKSDLTDSTEAAARAEAALEKEIEFRDELQAAMEKETQNSVISIMSSSLRASNAKVDGLTQEVLLRKSTVVDKRKILHSTLVDLSKVNKRDFESTLEDLNEDERAALEASLKNGEVVISKQDMSEARNTVGYKGSVEKIEQLTDKIEATTLAIEKKQEEINWAIAQGSPRIEVENAFGEDISELVSQREEDLKTLAVVMTMQDIFAANLKSSNPHTR